MGFICYQFLLPLPIKLVPSRQMVALTITRYTQRHPMTKFSTGGRGGTEMWPAQPGTTWLHNVPEYWELQKEQFIVRSIDISSSHITLTGTRMVSVAAEESSEHTSAYQLYSNSPLLSYSPFYGILTIFII